MTSKQKGFTLIELMLAMAFIAFMLLFITSAILQATKLYVKGSAIRQINQAGRQVLADIGTSMRYSKPNYVAGNRLCVGGVSYVWNIEGAAQTNVFAAPNSATSLHLVSVEDQPGALCAVTPFGAIDKTKAKILVGDEATVLKFVLSPNDSLWDVFLVLSTAGGNVATTNVSTPTGFSCDMNNQFCALGDFETSIYSRAGGN